MRNLPSSWLWQWTLLLFFLQDLYKAFVMFIMTSFPHQYCALRFYQETRVNASVSSWVRGVGRWNQRVCFKVWLHFDWQVMAHVVMMMMMSCDVDSAGQFVSQATGDEWCPPISLDRPQDSDLPGSQPLCLGSFMIERADKWLSGRSRVGASLWVTLPYMGKPLRRPKADANLE